jgi:hypothetical protein
MNEIDNIALIIMLRLLINENPLELVISSSDDLQTSIDNLTIFLKWSFKKLNKDTIKITFNSVTIKLTLNDRAELVRFITEYAQEYEAGNIIENSNTTPIAYTSLLKQFKGFIDTKRNLNRYVITNAEYTPLILKLYADNNNSLRDIEISLTSCEDVEYPIVSYGDKHWKDFFDYRLVVNISSLFRGIRKVKEVSKEHKTEGLKGYSTQMQQFDKFLSSRAKTREYSFIKLDIVNEGITKNLQACDTLLSRYNNIYKSCYNGVLPFHFDKEEKIYIIDNINEQTGLYISIESFVSKS